MTTTQFILIILAIAAMFFGLYLMYNTSKRNKKIAQTLALNADESKDGLPIVPRDERPEFNQKPTVTLHDTPSTAENPALISQDTTGTSVPTTISPAMRAEQADLYPERHTDQPSTFASSSTLLNSQAKALATSEEDPFSSLASATEAITPAVQTFDERQLKNEKFAENSPILDNHLQAQADQEQNNPLNHAEQNINISLFPNQQFRRFSGKDLLQRLDSYGIKYGAMNMFHRYENKDGTGVLWFSMMQVDDEGISPFDLNKLPTQSLNGLVMFLSLPHPKALQGFDSMMSIAGLLARDLDASIYDETGEPISRENTQAMRDIAMNYGKY